MMSSGCAIAMYQRYGGGNMDEGWTRLTLEQFQLSVHVDLRSGDQEGRAEREVRRAHLPERFDGDDHGRGSGGGCGGGPRRSWGRGAAAAVAVAAANTPPEYRTGLGAEGVTAIREFVQKGGTLVTLNGGDGVRDRAARHRGAQRADAARPRRSSGARGRR